MPAPSHAPLRLTDAPDGACSRLLAGIERVQGALQRRYHGSAGTYGAGEYCWLGGRTALALRAGDVEAIGRLPVDVHLRHPDWFDETQLDYWFGDFFPSIERPDRLFDAHDGRVERRGLAARLLHTLSLDDDDRITVIVTDADGCDAGTYLHVPVLSAGRVAVAELWRVAISLRRPVAHSGAIGRSVYALVTLLDAERRLGRDFAEAVRSATRGLADLPVRTRRGDDASTVEVVQRVSSLALDRLEDPLVVTSASQEYGDVAPAAIERLRHAIERGFAAA